MLYEELLYLKNYPGFQSLKGFQLLQKNQIEITQGLAFSDFINKHSLKSCAVLDQNNSYYYVKHSIGFDALSIISSVSTADFWDGICRESQTVYTFSEKSLSPLLQLFSENLKYNLQELFI